MSDHARPHSPARSLMLSYINKFTSDRFLGQVTQQGLGVHLYYPCLPKKKLS